MISEDEEEQHIYKLEFWPVGIDNQAYQNSFRLYPNPATDYATLTFNLNKAGHVRISVFSILGREQTVLVNESRLSGLNELQFDVSKLDSGMYFIRLETDRIATIKLIVK